MNIDNGNVVENDEQLQQLLREAEEQRRRRLALELERGTDSSDPPSVEEHRIRELWSEVSRVRRNDPSFTDWCCFLPQFYEPSLFRSWHQALVQSKHLRSIRIASEWILLEDVAQAVAKGLERTKVESLFLNCFTQEEPSVNNWPIVYQGLQSNHSIQQLTLTGVPLHYHCDDEALLLPQSLQVLILNHVTLTKPGADALVKGMCQSSMLESLTITLTMEDDATVDDSDDVVPQRQGLLYANMICETLMKNQTSLTKLELHGGQWCDNDMTLLGIGMNTNTSITKLVLKQCDIRDEGAQILFLFGIRRNVTLTNLTLDECGIGDVGIGGMMGKWLPGSSIHALALSNNRVGPGGVRRILDALRELPSMQILDLSGNRGVGYEGLRFIGDDLTNQPYLTHIELTNCATWKHDADSFRLQVEEQLRAGKALLCGIKRNQQIKSLNLQGIVFCPLEVKYEIQYYVGLNICGRHLLSMHHELATSVWCDILAKCQQQDYHCADLTYFFLREQPNLVLMARHRHL